MLWQLLSIGVGGALGTLARVGVFAVAERFGSPGAPIGVLTVNVLGSFIFGLIVGLAKQPGGIVTPLEKTLLVGVLGGFTTFSTFAFDAVTMLESGRMLTAFLFIVGSNVGAILGMWLGIRLMSL